jgi:hypothetical protein
VKYPAECPVFEIIDGCPECKGSHTTGAPSQYHIEQIDVWSCVDVFEPFALDALRPLTAAARAMIAIAETGGVKYPGKKGRLPV